VGTLPNNKTGIMVHHVIRQVDRGGVILTREIEVRAGDTLAALEERIHAHEHELLVEATAKMVAEIREEGEGRAGVAVEGQ
jgi:phosphoribosylglycinamide formyltransferase